MSVHCNITFDNNPTGTFFSGSVVSGKVEINLSCPKTVRGIAIKFSGNARTRWTETESHHDSRTNKSKRETVHYRGHEDYLTSTTYLVGSNNGVNITVDPGIHTYSFACGLPFQLPSSFEGRYGYVRYSVKIVLDRPWKFDQTHVIGMTVLKLVDLNYESPVLRMPPQVQTIKEFWCGPCASAPLTFQVKLPQTGYVPGQTIVITAEINNSSHLNVTGVHFALRKIIKYHSQFPHKMKIEVLTIVTKITGPIPKRSHKILQEILEVPALPPTCTNLCKIIQISYEIQAMARVKGFHQSPRIMIPIVIGNIPLVNVISQQPTSNERRDSMWPVIDNIVNNRNNNNTSSLMNEDYSDLPPPSYEEAVLANPVDMNEDDQHAISTNKFVPRYPVYRFTNQTASNLNANTIYSSEQPGHDNPGYRWSEIPSAPECNTPSNDEQSNSTKRWTEIPSITANSNALNQNDVNEKTPGTWL